jgi:hypothetical protein
VSQMPQRPFVPHRTPKASPQVITGSEFRLSRPFVPGPERDVIEVRAGSAAVESGHGRAESNASLPPIEDFLDTSPHPGTGSGVESLDDYDSIAEEPDELPPVEHFIDPLPEVGAFAPDADGALLYESAVTTDEYIPQGGRAPQGGESGWVETDWQQYDWRAAAALGEGVEAEASNEWAATNWEAGASRANEMRPTAAQAIANALDQIAKRIRDGELAIPSPGAMTDPATIAATIAALLGVRR